MGFLSPSAPTITAPAVDFAKEQADEAKRKEEAEKLRAETLAAEQAEKDKVARRKGLQSTIRTSTRGLLGNNLEESLNEQQNLLGN